mmetsp:Transcript_13964/g.48658  ORF Transcript_13964/g.48658 Transcript_13964/m.48658 type:complete len:204 (+) Transcript_13964:4957-5568(+)
MRSAWSCLTRARPRWTPQRPTATPTTFWVSCRCSRRCSTTRASWCTATTAIATSASAYATRGGAGGCATRRTPSTASTASGRTGARARRHAASSTASASARARGRASARKALGWVASSRVWDPTRRLWRATASRVPRLCMAAGATGMTVSATASARRSAVVTTRAYALSRARARGRRRRAAVSRAVAARRVRSRATRRGARGR